MGRPKKVKEPNQESVSDSELTEIVFGKEEVAEKEKPKRTDKENALALARASIEKDYGKGSIMTIRGYKDDTPVEHVSTGSRAFDVVIGRGGLTFGRVAEVFGPEGAGKTTFVLGVIANAQKLGLTCAFIDKENALDPDYAEAVGVDLEKTLLSQPSTGEEALNIAERLINSGAVDVIVVDSVANLNAKVDLEKTLDEAAVRAESAALLKRFFGRNDATISKNRVLFICINQIRDNQKMFGGPEIRPGGHALKHAASYMIDLRPIGAEKLVDSNGVHIGNRIKAKTLKNKLASPYREAHYDLIFGKGIDKVKDRVELAQEVGIISKAEKGSWMEYEGNKIQGMSGAKEFFSDPDKFKELDDKIVALVGSEWGREGKTS